MTGFSRDDPIQRNLRDTVNRFPNLLTRLGELFVIEVSVTEVLKELLAVVELVSLNEGGDVRVVR